MVLECLPVLGWRQFYTFDSQLTGDLGRFIDVPVLLEAPVNN